MKKLFFTIILVVVLITAFSASAWAASDYNFNITTSDVSSAKVGDQVMVKLTLKNNSGKAFTMYSMQDYIVYDTSHFSYVAGSAVSDYMVSFPELSDSSQAQVRVSYLSMDGNGVNCPASTVLVTFKLKVLKTGYTSIINNIQEMSTKTAGLYSTSTEDAQLNIGAGGGNEDEDKEVQKPTIKCGSGGSYKLSADGSKLTIIADDGYEIKDVVLNGVSKGAVSRLTDLETGDVVVITFAKKEDTGTGTGGAAQFTDVPINAWYYNAVDYVVKNGLFTGISSTSFEPNTAMNRAMLVTVLYRLEGEPSVSGLSNSFPDVAAGYWFTNGVTWGAANSIVKGYSNGKFGPTDLITREQLATIMYRYSQYKGYDTAVSGSLGGFGDGAKVSAYAIDGMKWAVGKGLIQGNNGNLSPQANASRAEVATILMRFMEMVK